MASEPLPYIVAPTYSFDGDDGSWSTFALAVGTPPQSFRVLPATVGEEVWVPVPEGCEGHLSDLSNCGSLRGANAVEGVPSRGFVYGNSSSWQLIPGGPYYLSSESSLFGNADTGLYGLDNVSLADKATGDYGPSLERQTVAGIAQQDFWLGVLGLGTSPGKFTGDSSVPSLMATLKNQSMIPSLSYGYTAGQSYASIPGSLVLGGYDASRLSADSPPISLPINVTSQSLQIGVTSIIASGALGGSTQQLLSKPLTANIDSAVSQLWLPADVCASFASAFGLTYNEDLNYYLVNQTIHQQLQNIQPSITLAVGPADGSGTPMNIEFPYASFDHNLTQPFTDTPYPYFPLRQAANESQYTLGRVFLQEAMLVVNYENATLTLGQAMSQNSTASIVPILPSSQDSAPPNVPAASATPAPHTHHKGLATGAIAGIVVVIIALIAAGAGYWLFRMRRKRRAAKDHRDLGALETAIPAPEVQVGAIHEHYPPEKVDDGKSPYAPWVQVSEIGMGPRPALHERSTSEPTSELDNERQIHEMEGLVHERELMSTPVFELEGQVGSELGSDDTINEMTTARRSKRPRPASPLSSRNSSEPSMLFVGDRGPFATPSSEHPPSLIQTAEDPVSSARSSEVPFSSTRSSELLSLRSSGAPLITPRISTDFRDSVDFTANEAGVGTEDQASEIHEVAVAVPVTPVRGRDVRLSNVRNTGFHVHSPTNGGDSRDSMETAREEPESSTDARSQHSWNKGDEETHSLRDLT